MKKIVLPLLSLLVAYFAVSCSSTPSYVNAIPADSDIVASVNIGALLDKSGFTKETDLQKLILETIEPETNRTTYSLIEEVISDVNKSGIDFSAPVYVIFTDYEDEDPFFVAKMGKEKNLDHTLDVLINEGACGNVASYSDSFKYTIFGNEDAILAYNKSSIFFSPIPYRAELDAVLGIIEGLMNNKASQSIAQNKAFDKMVSLGADITTLFDFGNMDIDEDDLFENTGVTSLDNTAAIVSANFDSGKISTKAELYSQNKEFDKQLKTYTSAFAKIDNKYFQYIPNSVLLAATVGTDGKKFLDNFRDELDSEGLNEEELGSEVLATVEKLFTLFTGDITVAYTDDEDMAIYADVSGKKDALEVISLVEDQLDIPFADFDEDAFFIDLGYGEGYYIGVSGSKMYFSDNRTIARGAFEKASKPLSKVSFVTNMNNKLAFFYANANSPVITESLPRDIRRNPALGYALDEVSHVEVSLDDDMSIEAHIVLKNSKENSLKVITDSAAKLFRSFMR